MPPPRSSKLEEYQRFQAGQAAQQAQMMQMLQSMYGIANQGTQQELARTELGLREQELGMRKELQPSEIASKLARAEYEKALALGYPAEQASVIANRAAQTAHTQEQTLGAAQARGFAPQEFASTLAQRGAQTQLTTEQARALGYENEFGQRNAATRAGLLEGQLGMQPYEQRGLELRNNTMQQQYDWQPILNTSTLAAQGAQTANIASNTEGQNIQNANAPLRNAMDLRLGNAQVGQIDANTAGQLAQNAWIGPLAQNQINLGKANIGSMTANDMLKLYSMGGATLPQLQQGGFPEQYKTIFGPGYKAAEDQRELARSAEEARNAASLQGSPVDQSYGASLGQDIGDYLGWQMRKQTAPLTFPFRAAGLGLRTKKGEKIRDIPFTPPKGNFWDYQPQ